MSSCRRNDARCVAARRVRALGDDHVVAYGTYQQMRLGIGAVKVARVGVGEQGWDALSDVLDSGQPVFGYLGFALHGATNRALAPSAVLVIPERVEVVEGTDDAPGICTCDVQTTRSGVEFDVQSGSGWLDAAGETLAWVRGEQGRRLTLARRVAADNLDLVGTLGAPPPGDSVARDFYVRVPDLEMVGQSPEVLAEGTADRFRTYKISGTGRRSTEATEDAELRSSFESSPKIVAEHASSATAMNRSLGRLGDVEIVQHRVLDLRVLRHLLTVFETRPAAGSSVTDCVRTVLPTGASPREDGLRLLHSLEPVSRGPYYGLVGEVRADGQFSFSQVLRAAFRDQEGLHLWAGAAITASSTAEGEYRETRLKLRAIRVAIQESV